MNIVQLIYRPNEPEGSSKDYEFSRSSMERRWRQGVADAQAVLRASPWLAPMPKDLGIHVFDVAELFAAEGKRYGTELPRTASPGEPQPTAEPRGRSLGNRLYPKQFQKLRRFVLKSAWRN
jgi:hypothetical protein